MDDVSGKGALLIGGQEIPVRYRLEMASAGTRGPNRVSGTVHAVELTAALPLGITMPGALRMAGGLEMAVQLKRGSDGVASVTALDKARA